MGLVLITAGALGNIIDSLLYGVIFSASTPLEAATFGGSYAPVFFGKVVDMFYFPLWTWPIIFQHRFFLTEDEDKDKKKK